MATIEAHVDLLLRDAEWLATPQGRSAWNRQLDLVIDQMIFYRQQMLQMDAARRAERLPAQENRQELGSLIRTEEAWLKAATILVETIEMGRASGFVPRRAEAFREICMRKHISGLEPAEIEDAEREFASGGGRSLAEVRDELRRRVV
jgi:hypothetical protein